MEKYPKTSEQITEPSGETEARLMGGVALAEMRPESDNEINLGAEFERLDPELQKVILEIKPQGKFLETESSYGTFDIKEGQDVELDNIVFIRTTDYCPVERGGKLVVETPYEATKNEEDEDKVALRLTTHWTTNHKVSSHMMGNWEGSPYTILSPGKKMVEANGIPLNLYPIDTFWNHNLELPEGTTMLRVGEDAGERLEIKNGINIIHLRPDEPVDSVISMVMKRMGYSEMSGGDHGSVSHKFESQLTTVLADEMGVELRGKHENAGLKGNPETLIEVGFENSMASLLVSRIEARQEILNNYWDKLPQNMKDLLIDRLGVIPDIDSINSVTCDQIEKTNFLFASDKSINLPEVYKFDTRKEIFDKKPPEFWIDYIKKLYQLEKAHKDAGEYSRMSDSTEIATDREGFMSQGYINSLAELMAAGSGDDLESLEKRLKTQIES